MILKCELDVRYRLGLMLYLPQFKLSEAAIIYYRVLCATKRI